MLWPEGVPLQILRGEGGIMQQSGLYEHNQELWHKRCCPGYVPKLDKCKFKVTPKMTFCTICPCRPRSWAQRQKKRSTDWVYRTRNKLTGQRCFRADMASQGCLRCINEGSGKGKSCYKPNKTPKHLLKARRHKRKGRTLKDQNKKQEWKDFIESRK